MSITSTSSNSSHIQGELIAAKQLAASYERSMKRMRPGLAKRNLRAALLRARARIRVLERQFKTIH